MAVRTLRNRIMALAFVAIIALCIPSLAFATTGDSWQNAEAQVIPFTSGEMNLNAVTYVGDPVTYYEYWYVVPLTAGQTIEMTSTSTPDADVISSIFSATYEDPYIMGSDYMSPGVQRLRYMAPHTDDYYVIMDGAQAGTFTVNAIFTPRQAFTLGSMIVPPRVKAYTSFDISMKLYPGYNSSTVPVRFYIQKKVGGVWKNYLSRAAKMSAGSTTYTKYSLVTKLKLGRGTYRARAKFRDEAHTSSKYNSYKTITVY